jgi:hypothetical protein
MKTALVALIAFLAGALLLRHWPLLPERGKGEPPVETKKADAPEAHSESASAAAEGIPVTAATQERLGLKTAPVSSVSIPDEVEAFGRVQDVSSLLSLGTELETAEAAAEASEKEWNRTRGLFAQDQNASARMLEQADAARRRDRALVAGVRARIASGWCPELARSSDLGTILHRFAAMESVLVRLDIASDRTPERIPSSARVVAVGTESAPVTVQILGIAASADPQLLGTGYLALMSSGTWAAGTPLTAWVAGNQPPKSHLRVPRSAIVRVEGGTAVYVQTAKERFQRRMIALARPHDGGWLVETGMKAGEAVVVTGAQALLSIESKTATPE